MMQESPPRRVLAAFVAMNWANKLAGNLKFEDYVDLLALRELEKEGFFK